MMMIITIIKERTFIEAMIMTNYLSIELFL